MDIENNNLLLVEIKHLIQTEDMDIWNYKNELTTLIDEAIARQSVKSEEWVSVDVEKPESGKHVLLCCEVRPIDRKYICVGFYAKPKSAIIPCYDDSNCEYDKETDEYYLQEGYYEVIKNWGDYSSIVIDDFVTHWKSLPEPPKGG